MQKKTKKQLLAKLNGGNDEAEAAMNQGDVQHALQIMLKTADLAQAVSTPSFGKDIDTFLERVGVKVRMASISESLEGTYSCRSGSAQFERCGGRF